MGFHVRMLKMEQKQDLITNSQSGGWLFKAWVEGYGQVNMKLRKESGHEMVTMTTKSEFKMAAQTWY